jgi:hypothetical protein
MKTYCLIPVALAAFLLAGCEEKPQSGIQTGPSPKTPSSPESVPSSSASSTPVPQSTPSPSPSVTAPPESTPSASASPKSPADTTPSPSAANSDARPTFSSQSANEYVQSYDAYINDFKLAYQAMKQGDMTKYQAVVQRAHELETKTEKLGGELTPEEQTRFADYLNRKADELAQFASQNR